MTTATARCYTTSVVVPSTVRAYFDTLRDFGTIKGVSTYANSGVTLYLSGDGDREHSLGARLRRLAQALGGAGLFPAFPTSGHWNPHGTLPGESYRWEFGDPVYAGDGQWSIVVPATDDLRHLLDTVSGLASYPDDYKGESILPVTYYPEDADDLRASDNAMREDLRSMEDDLEAWLGETVQFETPTLVTD